MLEITKFVWISPFLFEDVHFIFHCETTTFNCQDRDKYGMATKTYRCGSACFDPRIVPLSNLTDI